MIRKRFMTVAALGGLMTCGAQPLAMTGNKTCGMNLPRIQPLDNFQGPVSGPFLLDEMPEPANSITLLSMNIQGLPDFIAKGKNPNYRDDRYDCLGKLASYFDMVAFQENFMRKVPIESQRPSAFTEFDLLNTGRLNATYNSGLSMNARMELRRKKEEAYSECNGLLGNANDCWAMKGYQEIESQDTIWVNTHLDADEDDFLIRAEQMMGELSNGLPKEGDVVFAGDINMKRENPIDQKTYIAFLKANHLTEVARSPKGLDVIAVRGVKVNWVGKVCDDLLSDHCGLVANLQLEPS